MSTPATFHFKDTEDGPDVAKIWKNWDGYPETAFADIKSFFSAVEREAPNDCRFYDPAYLAARFVVYLSREYGEGLNFISVGVVNDEYEGNYAYDIICNNSTERPGYRTRR